MNVSPTLLRTTAAALSDVAEEVRSACRAAGRAGPGDPDWATDTVLRAQAAAWDRYLDRLADRLDDLGDRLLHAADEYRGADLRAGRRYPSC